MAGAMRKMAVYLGLVEDDEGYDADYEPAYETDEVEAADYDARSQPPPRAIRVTRPDERTAPAPRAGVATAEAYRITTLHPRTYNEARQIGEQFRDGSPVIMNLSDMDDADAKRLVDFAAGLVFGRHGSIEKVTQKVFLLTPPNVEITPEDRSRMAGAPFFNQS
jgi:cell division inhibitor SepF